MPAETIRALFDAACQLPINARAAWLAAQAVEPQIAARVRQLLAAEHARASVLDRPFVEQLHGLAQPQAAMTTSALIDTQIDGYRLLSLLGQGGMAQVFAAERLGVDFTQQVAVKLLRRHLHSEFELRLFQRERQSLANLEHPNIAHLLDGGVTAAGVPYLVMELVRGVNLIQHARQHSLSLRARLALFAQVCDGVNAAHRALIVHRDIKPANILVNLDGVVKLLDFGVAKLLDDQGDQQNATFAPLTPEYAAPEQFDGRAVTTATDVFGLGVVLHELLVGVRPERAGATLSGPIRASDLVTTPTTLELTAPPIRAHELKRFLRGDIDNILRQALAAEPNDRYASAGDLAADLRRFLDGQPVQAHPASAWYRSAKFVRRNRVAVALCGVLLAALLLSGAYASTQARRAEQMALMANARAADAHKQTLAAQAALSESYQVQRFFYDIIRAVNPNAALDAPATMREVLEQAQTRLGAELGDQPAVQIELYGFFRQIREQFGDNPQAIALGQKQVALALKTFGAHHEKTAAAQFQLARLLLFAGDDSGFAMLQSAVAELNAIAPASLNRAYALVAFAGVQSQRGRIEEALVSLQTAAPLLLQLCANGEKNACKEQIAALSHLGIALYQKRDYKAAVIAFTEGAARAEKIYGPVHSMTLRLQGNLATCQVQIDPNTAITTMQGVMRLTATLPDVAIDTVPAQHNGLGLALSRVAKSKEAALEFQAALDAIDASQRKGPQQKIFSLNLISELILLGDLAAARKTLNAVRAILPPTEDNYIHLARADEFAAWLDVLAGKRAAQSYAHIASARQWRMREANPRLPDILKTLALGLRIAARYQDQTLGAEYLAQITLLSEDVAVLPDSVEQELFQARFEFAIAHDDTKAAHIALDGYEKVIGSFRPNAALNQWQLMRLKLVGLDHALPPTQK